MDRGGTRQWFVLFENGAMYRGCAYSDSEAAPAPCSEPIMALSRYLHDDDIVWQGDELAELGDE